MRAPIADQLASVLSLLSKLIVDDRFEFCKSELRELHRRLSADFSHMRKLGSLEAAGSDTSEAEQQLAAASEQLPQAKEEPTRIKESIELLHDTASKLEKVLEVAS